MKLEKAIKRYFKNGYRQWQAGHKRKNLMKLGDFSRKGYKYRLHLG